ncbi:MAG: rhodanese-like domain-containing protein [Lentisphaerae bacterium]|nr:rhodanese-like domain-containing protein [Lentisphaerota bacterium]
MKSMNLYRSALLVLCLSSATGYAITSAELRELMDADEAVTVIDIRSENFYSAGHIPNAINIPERVLEFKNLPPLGRVVVYGSGVGMEKMDKAVMLLNEKEGITAEALEGGYAAWESTSGTTTQPPGFQPEKLNYVTYQSLEEIDESNLVLVDLRKADEVPTGRLTRQGEEIMESEPLTPLAEKFPGRAVVKSPFDVPAVAQSSTGGSSGGLQRMAEEPPVPPVMVLIDSGDGSAEKMARILKANGVNRVIILAGGEEILKRDGKPGLMRMGAGAQTVTVEDNDE